MKLFETWKKVMFDPLNFYEKLPKKIRYKEPSWFFLKIQAITLGILYLFGFIILAFFALIFGAVAGIFGKLSAGLLGIIVLIAILLYPVLLLLSWGMLFVGVGITHLFVLIFGGKQKYVETFKALAYALAPQVFSPIPLVGYAAAIYSLVLQVMGIKHRQKLSWGKSVAVVLLPMVLIAIIVVLLYFFFIFSVLSTSLAAGELA